MSLLYDTLTIKPASRGVGRPDYSAPYSTLFTTDCGYATGGSMTTLIDTTKNWQVNIWRNAALDVYVGGTKYTRYVVSNTATTLTFATITPATVSGGVQYFLRERSGIAFNRMAWAHNTLLIAVALTPIQFPDITVPDGFPINITALPGNAGIVYIQNAAAPATNPVALDNGVSKNISVTNTNLLFLTGANVGDGVDWFVEQ